METISLFPTKNKNYPKHYPPRVKGTFGLEIDTGSKFNHLLPTIYICLVAPLSIMAERFFHNKSITQIFPQLTIQAATNQLSQNRDTKKFFLFFFKKLLTNHSAYVIIISERKKEVNNNDTWNNIYFRRTWTCFCRSYRLDSSTPCKLKKIKKIFKKLLTNHSRYVIINTERTKRGK